MAEYINLQSATVLLMMIGIFGLLINRNVIKMIISLNVFEIGLTLFIVSLAYVKDGVAPILTAEKTTSALTFVDPLLHALVLTAIVIGVGTTALGLVFAQKLHSKYGTYELDEMRGEM